ncbi:MAG: lipocalin family protein [Methylococcales bacterium]|nr:lipocalin family protein [Methylococcales bacterium]MDD5214882.1 lipocalin family protein [Methylococcales bacterium]
MFLKQVVFLLSLLLIGCVGIPENIKPIDHFNAQKYLGTWHEIARLDHSFERGLINISANYSLRDDGGIKVLNRGYSPEKKEWNEAEGKAYFVQSPNDGYLKVSFFEPFYGSYIIFDLDENYRYSLISGPDKSYFWLLARDKKIDEAVKTKLVSKAAALGFDTSKLIYTTQD